MTAPVLSLDLGSVRIGCVFAPHALPLTFGPDDAATIPVDARDLEPTVSGLAALLSARPPSAVVVEHGTLFIPQGAGQAKAQAIAANHEVCARILERITVLCRDRGVPLATIARATWAHRVCPGTKGGITDAMAADGLRAHVDPTALAILADQDQRDATGALVGWLLGPPKRKARARRQRGEPRPVMTAEQRAEKKRKAVDAAKAARTDRRAAKGCTCGPDGGPRPTGIGGRHPRTCPAAPPPMVHGSQAAAEAYVPMTRWHIPAEKNGPR